MRRPASPHTRFAIAYRFASRNIDEQFSLTACALSILGSLFLKLFGPLLRPQITPTTEWWLLPGDFRPLTSDFSPCRSGLCSSNLVPAVDADNLKKRGWSLGWVSSVDSERRTIWIADAHRGDGQRFIVRADERLTAFSRTRSGDSVSKLEAWRSASHLRLRT